MAGTIVVDRIESDASYTSTINVANRITFSNTVNFGVFAGTAPVAGFYLPTTNNLAFTTASTERMRIDSSGNVVMAGTLTTSAGGIAKASLPTGSVLQVVSSTPSSVISNSSSFIDLISQSITPTSANSKILVTFSGYIGISGNNDRLTGFTQLLRGATVVWGPNSGPTQGIDDPSGYHYFVASGTLMYLDSPATTSSTTYSIQGKEDSDQWATYNSATLILMEIAG